MPEQPSIADTLRRKLAPLAACCLVVAALALVVVGLGVASVSRMNDPEVRFGPRPDFTALARPVVPVVEAIDRYQYDHGLPPEDLALLVPDYLVEIPSFDCGPLRYNAQHLWTGYTLSLDTGWNYANVSFNRAPQRSSSPNRWCLEMYEGWEELELPVPALPEPKRTSAEVHALQLEECSARVARHPHQLWAYRQHFALLWHLDRKVEALRVTDLARAQLSGRRWPQVAWALQHAFLHSPREAELALLSWLEGRENYANLCYLALFYHDIDQPERAAKVLARLSAMPPADDGDENTSDRGLVNDIVQIAYQIGRDDLVLAICRPHLKKYWIGESLLAIHAASELRLGRVEAARATFARAMEEAHGPERKRVLLPLGKDLREGNQNTDWKPHPFLWIRGKIYAQYHFQDAAAGE